MTVESYFAAIAVCLQQIVASHGRILLVLDNVTEPQLLSAQETDALTALSPQLHLLATTRMASGATGIRWLTLGELSEAESLELLEKCREFADDARARSRSSHRATAGRVRLGRRVGRGLVVGETGSDLRGLPPASGTGRIRDAPRIGRRHRSRRRTAAAQSRAPAASRARPHVGVADATRSASVGIRGPAAARPRAAPLAANAGRAGFSSKPPVPRLPATPTRGPTSAASCSGWRCLLAARATPRNWSASIGWCNCSSVANYRQRKSPRQQARPSPDDAPRAGHRRAVLRSRTPRLSPRARPPQIAVFLNNLAQLLQATNRLAEAEPLMRRALAIDEQSYGAEPRCRQRPEQPGELLEATNRLAEAEPLMRRALAIDEQSYGAEHPNVANRLNNLAQLLQATNRLAEAEPLMRRALAIDEQSYGAEHPDVANRPQQPGSVAAGHEPSGGGRAADAPRAGHQRAVLRSRAPQRRHRPQQPGGSCFRPRTVWRRPSR
jgi:phage tail protein X